MFRTNDELKCLTAAWKNTYKKLFLFSSVFVASVWNDNIFRHPMLLYVTPRKNVTILCGKIWVNVEHEEVVCKMRAVIVWSKNLCTFTRALVQTLFYHVFNIVYLWGQVSSQVYLIFFCHQLFLFVKKAFSPLKCTNCKNKYSKRTALRKNLCCILKIVFFSSRIFTENYF